MRWQHEQQQGYPATFKRGVPPVTRVSAVYLSDVSYMYRRRRVTSYTVERKGPVTLFNVTTFSEAFKIIRSHGLLDMYS